MNQKTQKYLLQLARNTIAQEFGVEKEFARFAHSRQKVGSPSGRLAEKSSDKIARPDDPILNEKRGVFVTLEIGGHLRGCIGNILPVYPLEEAVQRNAINAGFEDPRFEPLAPEEFNEIEIEISVLSIPKKLEYSGVLDLLEKLVPLKDGVIIKKGGYEATYLPQVWEDLKDKNMFLSSLCMKAGLNADEWKSGGVQVSTYQAEVFKE